MSSGSPLVAGLSRLMVHHEPYGKIPSRLRRVVHNLPLLKLEGLALALIDADPAYSNRWFVPSFAPSFIPSLTGWRVSTTAPQGARRQWARANMYRDSV